LMVLVRYAVANAPYKLFIRGEDKSGFGEEVEKKGIVIEENR